MKKICIITTISYALKAFVLPTAERLHQSGEYDVTLISSDDEKFAKELPEYIHFIPVNMKRGVTLSGFKAISKFRKIFKREKFDLVQYSTPNAAFYASIAAKQTKVPIRIYAQWGMRYVGLSGFTRRIFKFLEKMICKRSTHIRSVSPMNMEFCINEGLYGSEKVKVLGRGGTIGVDTREYDFSKKQEWRSSIREENNISDAEFVYGFVGRVSIDKGYRELIQAFKGVLEKKSKARLMIIGNNETNSDLEKILDAEDLVDKVVITGKIESNRMKEYYSALDVLVHPTYREGFGMVIQEAGALAIPTITTRIPGASEVMEENNSCLLVTPKSVEELQEAMERLYDDRDLCSSLGNGAYKMVCEHYERNKMLDNLQADYNDLLR